MRFSYLLSIASLLLAATVFAGQKAKPGPAKPVSYKQVKPIFDKNCGGCHEGKEPAHGLNMLSYGSIMKGDKEGKVVVAKNPTASRLSTFVHRTDQRRMPPPPEKMLTAAQLKLVDAWIKAGAKN